MGTAEAIIFQNLYWWQQAVGLIIALIIAIFFIWLFREIRECVWKRSKYLKGTITTPLNKRWGLAVLLGALLFFGYVIAVVILLFGQENFTEGIVVASALTVFLIFQLPRLLKPHIHITFLCTDDEGERTLLSDLGKPLNQLTLYTNKEHKIHLHINNLGVNIYENWAMFISFPSEITIIGFESSATVSYRYQDRNNTAICGPSTQIPFGPDDAIICKIVIKAPNIPDTYTINIEFKCSTRWAETEQDMYLNVIPNKEPKESNLDHQTI